MTGDADLSGWIEPEQRAVVVYLPLRSVERQLQAGDNPRFELLSARIQELRGDNRLAGIEVAAEITNERGEPALQVKLTPRLFSSAGER